MQPLFDYVDVTWGEISEGCYKDLQRLQNRAARIILQEKTSKDTLPVLNWLNLACGRKIHKYNLVFKSLNILVPEYVNQYLQGIGPFMIMRLEEVTTCTHQSRNTIWERELLSMQEKSVLTHYPLKSG